MASAAFGVGATPPEEMSAFGKKVLDLLRKHTPFAWPILTAQCRRAGVDPARLDSSSLPRVEAFLAEGVGAFTSPAKAKQVAEELHRLVALF